MYSWSYGALVLSLLTLFVVPNFGKLWRWFGTVAVCVFLFLNWAEFEPMWVKSNLADSSIFLIWLGLLCPVFFLLRPDMINLKHLLVIYPISILAGLVTAWTSSVWVEGALGLLPAAVLSLFFMVRTLNMSGNLFRLIPVFLLLLCISIPQFLSIYQELPLIDLRTRVTSGPYHGMFTAQKSALLYEITSDLASVSAGRRSIFIFSEDPGIYLMSDLIPTGPLVWASPAMAIPIQVHMIKEFFSLPDHLPDVLMVMGGDLSSTSWFHNMGYIKKLDKASYRVYVKNKCIQR